MGCYNIALIPGDGIGPELTDATLKVLAAVQKRSNLRLNLTKVNAGDECLVREGIALPPRTIQTIQKSHACIKGPVGETAVDVIVKLRIMFDLYANIRPIKSYPVGQLINPDIDLVFVRENTEDVYKGLEFSLNRDTAICIRTITRRSCERIAKKAFEMAKKRKKKKKVTAVHKANVMKVTCGLFASVCRETAEAYPSIEFEEQYVDATAMRLIKAPSEFDVIVTTNMFGDILSDEAAQMIGGLGMAPAANVGDSFGIFEPIHGSAPDIARKQLANPISMILASKMMLEWLGERHNDYECLVAGKLVENAVTKILSAGLDPSDIAGVTSTSEIGANIANQIYRARYPHEEG